MLANHPDGRCDLVAEFIGLLPLQIICDMLGIPEEDHQKVFHWTTVLMNISDADVIADFDEIYRLAMEIGDGVRLAEDRRAHPRDDLTTNLVRAEVDGERLTSDEIVASSSSCSRRRATRRRATRSATACWR